MFSPKGNSEKSGLSPPPPEFRRRNFCPVFFLSFLPPQLCPTFFSPQMKLLLLYGTPASLFPLAFFFFKGITLFAALTHHSWKCFPLVWLPFAVSQKLVSFEPFFFRFFPPSMSRFEKNFLFFSVWQQNEYFLFLAPVAGLFVLFFIVEKTVPFTFFEPSPIFCVVMVFFHVFRPWLRIAIFFFPGASPPFCLNRFRSEAPPLPLREPFFHHSPPFWPPGEK